jgi:hypothetical protein
MMQNEKLDAERSEKICLFISLERPKKKRNRSHFVSFHFEGKKIFRRNRRTLGLGGRRGTATCHGKEGIKPVPQVHPIFTVLLANPHTSACRQTSCP